MRAPVSVGYLTPDDSRIRSLGHTTSCGGRPVTEEGVVPDWHYLTDVTVEWQLEVDIAGLLDDCGLSTAARIGGLVTWHSDRTNLRGGSEVAPVSDGLNRLGLHLPGTDLGGTLNLEARIVLTQPDPRPRPFAPERRGSTLWQATTRIILEGSGGRFPTTACDFDAAGLPGGHKAMWYLEISSRDLDSAATRCLRLYLNTANPDMQELLDQPESRHAALLRRMLRYETTRQLLNIAVSDEEFDDRASYDDGTLGHLLVTVIRTTAPGRGVDQLRGEYTQRPAEMDAEILSAAWAQEA